MWKSTDKYLRPPRIFPQPHSTNANTPQPSNATPARRNQSLHGVQWLGQGRVEGGKYNNVNVGVVEQPPKVDTSMWPARHCSHWQLPRLTIGGEDRRRGEERMRGCNERMWRNGHPFIHLSGPPVVTASITAADSLV